MNMKTKRINRRFIDSTLIILSVTAFAMLALRFMAPTTRGVGPDTFSNSRGGLFIDLYSAFTGGGFERANPLRGSEAMREYLALNLILIAWFSVLKLRSSKESENSM